MTLVEECVLPELANRRVLKRVDRPLTETIPASRPISVRDLLTPRMGFGAIIAPPDTYPIQTAIRERRLSGDGPPMPAETPAPDEWMRLLGELPWMAEPGERWIYVARRSSGSVAS